jgi:UPF0755 protein
LKTFLTLIVILLLAGAAFAGYMWYSLERPYGVIPSEGIFVDIPHGSSERTVARLLKNAGVLRSDLALDLYARRHSKRALQAGEYFFDHPLTGREVFWKLANGEVFAQPFTVKEGDTIFDIAENLQKAKIMTRAQFLQAANDPKQIHDIAPTATSLEGFLFPATYNLPRQPAPVDLTAMMVRKFREALHEIAPEGVNTATSNSTSLLALVTLASLVERETPKPDERLLVAGIFTNRLKKGMMLQCDPTVIYALQMQRRYNGTLTGKDLHLDSPYNTYVHTGLPPGPIGNPGEVALKAALNPADTPYLYFVANTHGGHFFASTLAEHNKNVTKYRQLLNGESAGTPTASENSRPPAQKGTR